MKSKVKMGVIAAVCVLAICALTFTGVAGTQPMAAMPAEDSVSLVTSANEQTPEVVEEARAESADIQQEVAPYDPFAEGAIADVSSATQEFPYFYNILVRSDPLTEFNFGPAGTGPDAVEYREDLKARMYRGDTALAAADMAYTDAKVGTRFMGVFYDAVKGDWATAINNAKETWSKDKTAYTIALDTFWAFMESAEVTVDTHNRPVTDQMYMNPYTPTGAPDVIVMATDQTEGPWLIFDFTIKNNHFQVAFRVPCGYQPSDVSVLMDIPVQPKPQKPTTPATSTTPPSTYTPPSVPVVPVVPVTPPKSTPTPPTVVETPTPTPPQETPTPSQPVQTPTPTPPQETPTPSQPVQTPTPTPSQPVQTPTPTPPQQTETPPVQTPTPQPTNKNPNVPNVGNDNPNDDPGPGENTGTGDYSNAEVPGNSGFMETLPEYSAAIDEIEQSQPKVTPNPDTGVLPPSTTLTPTTPPATVDNPNPTPMPIHTDNPGGTPAEPGGTAPILIPSDVSKAPVVIPDPTKPPATVDDPAPTAPPAPPAEEWDPGEDFMAAKVAAEDSDSELSLWDQITAWFMSWWPFK